MADRRRKDLNWIVANEQGETRSWEEVQIAVLMDIRDELKVVSRKLSALECPNFVAIPKVLKDIRRQTAKRRKPRVVGKPKLRVVRS